jgi:hypothetical protein
MHQTLQTPYGQVLAGAVLKIAHGWPDHADVVGFDGRVSESTTPNLRVVFDGIPIMCYSQRRGARCPSRRLEDGFPDWAFMRCHGGEVIRPCIWIQA